MTKRQDPNPEFDFFIPLMGDIPLKDQRETMERPFFSLQKRKRLKPIEYKSPDGEQWVKVEAIPAYGMATIWDADILIWAASSLNRMKQQGVNDLPRTLHTTSYDLLRAIKRDTSGRSYQDLQSALQRLQTTSISTSIRAPKRQTKAGFNWLDKWTLDSDPVTGDPRGMSITLSDWVYEGIVGERSLLTMHTDYFLLTGGLERALYRIARKHVGSQRGGWTCRVELLLDKTGSDSPPKEFNRMLRKIVERNQLPEYALTHTTVKDGQAAIHFELRGEAEAAAASLALEAEQSRLARRQAETPAPLRLTPGWRNSGAEVAEARVFTHRIRAIAKSERPTGGEGDSSKPGGRATNTCFHPPKGAPEAEPATRPTIVFSHTDSGAVRKGELIHRARS